jgi:lipoprotein NlpD
MPNARAPITFMHLPSSSRLHSRTLIVAACIAALIAGGCSTRRPAPVEDRATNRSSSAPVLTGPTAGAPATPSTGTAVAPAPTPTYTVKRGDTLHQIALDTGLDYKELAAWNNIENVNVIRVGQVLRLTAPGDNAPVQGIANEDGTPGVTTAPLRSAPAVVESKAASTAPSSAAPAPISPAAPTTRSAGVSDGLLKTSPKAVKEPYSDQAVRELTLAASAVPAPPDALAMAAPTGPRVETKTDAVKPEPKADTRNSESSSPSSSASPPTSSTPSASSPAAADSERLDWAWPTKGKIISGFSDTANLKGIDIAGTAGQAIHASAAGRVVYAGSGLRGYGKLIIIKHNATYLSAYAHNREILVKEGQQVTRGQTIAEMGNTDADQVKLHFEIRRQGKPMDPTKYLPPA